eukprot:g1716.t1
MRIAINSPIRLAPIGVRRVHRCYARRTFVPEICIGAVSLYASIAGPSLSADLRKLGEFNASGLVFKDSVEVLEIDDPEVSGVTLYFSDFKRSFTDKLSNMDFANEPSQASITCAATGPVEVTDLKSIAGPQGKQVFSETRSRSFLFFGNKTLRIRRVYDESRKALVYIAYSTRMGSAGDEGKVSAGRYRTSICVVPFVKEAPKVTDKIEQKTHV